MANTLQLQQSGPDEPPPLGRDSRRDRRVKAHPRESPAELLNEVEADLRTTGRLCFRNASETRFQQARAPERIRHFVSTSLIGLFLYDLFLIPDALMLPDFLSRTVMIHLGIVTPVGLLVVYLIHLRKVSTDSMVGVLLLILGNALYTSRNSHAPDAIFISFTIPIMVVFSNIVLPLPFRVAVGFSIIAAATAFWCVRMQPSMDVGAQVFAILTEINVGVFTLIATYRIEKGERQAYLLTLRETLRGETLVEQNRELSELSETDGLTGIANRRVFDRNLEQLWNEHLQSRTPIALLLIDIDHFKRLNDTHGHMNGDICLRKTADRLRRLMNVHQSLARYGGEEFAVLLEGEGARRAEAVAEKLRAEIETMPVHLAGTENKPHHITISVGCATVIPRAGLSPAELFLAADEALYKAKHDGRNRIHASLLEPSSAKR